MRQEFYKKIAAPYEQDAARKKRLLWLNTWITRGVYLLYPILLAVLLFQRDARFLRVFLVPAISFAAVTLLRKGINARRPYELWDMQPLIPKETKGNSFPSRHVFSIYIISAAAAYIYLPLGGILAAAGVFLAAVRVIAGVHFVKDVLAGAILAAVCGWIGLVLL